MELTFNLVVHIITGSIAVLSGLISLLAKKGAKLHRWSGNVFFVSMLIMALSGTLIAWLKPMMISVIAGGFTCYLITTSWMAVKTPPRTTSYFDYIAAMVALSIFIAAVVFGLQATQADSGLKDGFSSGPYFFFAALALIAFCLDVRMLVFSGVAGAHRIARHLWRMCFSLNIAIGSFLTQGERMLPKSVLELPFVAMAEDLILLTMFFWLARVLVWSKAKNKWRQFKSKLSFSSK